MSVKLTRILPVIICARFQLTTYDSLAVLPYDKVSEPEKNGDHKKYGSNFLCIIYSITSTKSDKFGLVSNDFVNF